MAAIIAVLDQISLTSKLYLGSNTTDHMLSLIKIGLERLDQQEPSSKQGVNNVVRRDDDSKRNIKLIYLNLTGQGIHIKIHMRSDLIEDNRADFDKNRG